MSDSSDPALKRRRLDAAGRDNHTNSSTAASSRMMTQSASHGHHPYQHHHHQIHQRGNRYMSSQPASRSHSMAASDSMQSAMDELEDEDEKDCNRPQRLSRHIPNREGMDMDLASYNLLFGRDTKGLSSFCSPVDDRHRRSSGGPNGNYGASPPQDDKFRVALAEKMGGPNAGIGGEVLKFGKDRGSAHAPHSSRSQPSSSPTTPLVISQKKKLRTVQAAPERVLDAPNLLLDNDNVLDWGQNNKILIGLDNVIYKWDAVTADAGAVLQLNYAVRSIKWMSERTAALVQVNHETAIVDVERQEPIARITLPSASDSAITAAVSGPILSMSVRGSSDSNAAIYSYDVRSSKRISKYESSCASVALQYARTEPYYLAAGGEDGIVRIWDARRDTEPKARLAVHRSAVTSVDWCKTRRNYLYTGGADGKLRCLNTFAAQRSCIEASSDIGSAVVGIANTKDTNEVVCAPLDCKDGVLVLKQKDTFKTIGNFIPNSLAKANVVSFALSPDGQRMCCALSDESLKFWKVFDDPPKSVKSFDSSPTSLSDFGDDLR